MDILGMPRAFATALRLGAIVLACHSWGSAFGQAKTYDFQFLMCDPTVDCRKCVDPDAAELSFSVAPVNQTVIMSLRLGVSGATSVALDDCRIADYENWTCGGWQANAFPGDTLRAPKYSMSKGKLGYVPGTGMKGYDSRTRLCFFTKGILGRTLVLDVIDR